MCSEISDFYFLVFIIQLGVFRFKKKVSCSSKPSNFEQSLCNLPRCKKNRAIYFGFSLLMILKVVIAPQIAYKYLTWNETSSGCLIASE